MNILESYTKAKRVVESCENTIQLSNARKYVNLFFEAFSEKKTCRNGLCYRKPFGDVPQYYDELKKVLHEKRLSFDEK